MTDDLKIIPSRARRLFDIAVHDELLRSTVRLARLALDAKAASVFVYKEDRDQLVFEACSGEGEDQLIGMAIPADRGIAGWVWSTGETVVVRDVQSDRRFDIGFAQQTGFVPNEIMAALLETEDDQIGVIEVLDAGVPAIGDLAAMDLLAEIAAHCSSAIALLQAARSLQPGLVGQFRAEPLLRLEAALTKPDGSNSADIGKLMMVLADLLESRS